MEGSRRGAYYVKQPFRYVTVSLYGTPTRKITQEAISNSLFAAIRRSYFTFDTVLFLRVRKDRFVACIKRNNRNEYSRFPMRPFTSFTCTANIDTATNVSTYASKGGEDIVCSQSRRSPTYYLINPVAARGCAGQFYEMKQLRCVRGSIQELIRASNIQVYEYLFRFLFIFHKGNRAEGKAIFQGHTIFC